ncbi:MAG: hypothetical protein WC554_10955 [Clostridia bacterium]
MRKFKSWDFEVDLDDPKTYEHLPSTSKELDDLMFKEIGQAYCYMNIWHKNIFGSKKRDGGQKKRVNKMINTFCENRKDHYDDIIWYQEQIYLFQNETENMC